MIKFKTIADTKSINGHWMDKEVPPFIVQWGDGVTETLRNTADFKHKYKKKGEYYITISGLQYPELSLMHYHWLEKVFGTLPPVDSIKDFFNGCINLIHVDRNFFANNTHHRVITGILSGVRKIRDVKFVTKLTEVVCADFAFAECDCADLNVLSGWGENIVVLDFAFYDRKYAHAPNENILSSMKNLVSAKSLFGNNHNMIECPMYFKNNKKLKHIDRAFCGCDIKDINPNWLSHLPETVESDKRNIFDPSVKIHY